MIAVWESLHLGCDVDRLDVESSRGLESVSLNVLIGQVFG